MSSILFIFELLLASVGTLKNNNKKRYSNFLYHHTTKVGKGHVLNIYNNLKQVKNKSGCEEFQ